jgi:hypothetical protein
VVSNKNFIRWLIFRWGLSWGLLGVISGIGILLRKLHIGWMICFMRYKMVRTLYKIEQKEKLIMK